MEFGREVVPLKITYIPLFLIPHFQPFKMTNVKTSEVDANLALLIVGP
jgi:hypothetical protein